MHRTFSLICARQMGHTTSCEAQASQVHRCLQGMKSTVFSSSEQTTHACSSSSSCRLRLTSACRRCTLCSCCSKRFCRWPRTMRSKASSSPSTVASSSFLSLANLPSRSAGPVPTSKLPRRLLLLDSASSSSAAPADFERVRGTAPSGSVGAEDGRDRADDGDTPGAAWAACLWRIGCSAAPMPPRPAAATCVSGCSLPPAPSMQQPTDSSSATISARSTLPFTAKATRGVHGALLSCAGGLLSAGDGADVGSTRNSSRLRRTSSLLHRTASQSASRSSCLLMKGLV
mmetsp:Transcript_38118/g.106086  ORF Transcript_38118/g.106086 Transcript_38118/m.106086 type:complete len:287 (-) Transcript_38118:210-1070(-)